MTDILRIPAHLRDLAIETFDLPVVLTNRLARAGITHLGDLEGLSMQNLLELQVSGPIGVQEIYEAVSEFLKRQDLPEQALSTTPRFLPETAPDAVSEALPTSATPKDPDIVPTLPATLAAMPLGSICSPRLRSTLATAGFYTLSDIVGATKDFVISATGTGQAAIDRLFHRIEQILAGELDPTLALADDPVQDLHGLLAAAGCTDIDREAEILERLHGFWGRPIETLEAIGSDLGVTRERTRQIRNRTEERVARALAWYEPETLRQARRALVRLGGLTSVEELARATKRAFTKCTVGLEGYLVWLIRSANHPSIRLADDATLVIGPPVGIDRFRRISQCIESLLAAGTPITIDEIVGGTEVVWGSIEPTLLRTHCGLIARGRSHELIPGLFSTKRWARAEWAEYVLQQEGAPLHFMEIATRANQLAGTDYHETGFNTVLNEDDRFVRVGAGDFALSAWGIESYSRFDEVIERYLLDRDCPEHEDEIKDELLAIYTVTPTTVSAMLTTNPDKFTHLGGGFWGLADIDYAPDPTIEREVLAILRRVGDPLTLDELRRRLIIQMGNRIDLITSHSLRRVLYTSRSIRRFGTSSPERFTLIPSPDSNSTTD